MDNNIPNWVRQALSIPVGDIRVPKQELEKRYIGILPQSLFWKEPDHLGYILLSSKRIVALESKYQKNLAKQKLLHDCVARNNRGIAYEKEGNINAAVELYEENIKPGCYPAMHSFDRLLVIYRRNGDYKNELRVCKRAVTVFKKMEKYRDRLEKIVAKMQKERSKN